MALRAVKPGETAPPKTPPKSVTEAAKSGTSRELLSAMRDRIARDVEDLNTPARDLAALTKRLMEVVRDIEACDLREAEGRDGDDDDAADAPFDASAL